MQGLPVQFTLARNDQIRIFDRLLKAHLFQNDADPGFDLGGAERQKCGA